MTRRAVLLPALALAAISAVAIATGQVPSTTDAPTGPVVRLSRHDRSPRLGDIRPVPPTDGRNPWEREPGPRHRGRGPQGLRVDTAVQDLLATPSMPSPSESFDGIGNVNNVLPPDTTGDVGPNHYVQWVNLSFAVYSKGTGTTPPTLIYGPAAGSTLWAGFGGPCEETNNGDPIVLYDHLADRWVMSQLSLPNTFLGIVFRAPFYQCIAVSATSDPLGAYHRYQFEFDKLNDYPKLGVWPNAYYLTFNQFTSVTLNFAGQGVAAFDRASMLAGDMAAAVYFDLAPRGLHLGGMLPADLDGPPPPAGSPGYFMQVDDDAWGYAPDQLQLWRFNVDWTSPAAATFTGPSALAVAPFDSDMCRYGRNCLPQPGTDARVDAIADRLMYRLQYRNFGDHESLVVNHTVDADGNDHAGIRWYEIRNPSTTPFIHQQGTYAPDDDHRWMGSAAMDRAGNLALGFTVTGPNTYPSIRYAGRLATDPAGVLAEGETTLAAGSGSQLHSSGRWGDYSTMMVDPVDDCTFWFTHEYYTATTTADWRTHIGVFSFPACTGAPDQPRLTVIATTPTAPESGATPGRLTVSRTGSTAAAVTVPYSVSGTATAGVDYTALPGSVTIPVGSADAVVDVAAIDDAVYEGHETVLVTLGPGAGYRLGIASAIVSIVDDEDPPDLVVTSVTAPPGAGAGMTIAIGETTANQGTGVAGESVTKFYLSTNTALEAGDVFLAGRPVPSLTPGISSQGSTNVTIPAGTAPGTYYVVAKADANESVAEALNANNTAVSAIVRIGADLVVSALTVPAAAAPGETFQVSETTSNTGGGASVVTTTRYYLSANITFEATDPEIGIRTVPALDPGGTSPAQPPLLVPPGTPAATYFVHAKADSDNTVAEIVETNNVRTSFVMKIGPDLTVANVTAPATAAAGATISVGDTTRNQGGGNAPASTTTYFFSTNALFDAGDRAIGGRPVGGIGTGGTNTGSGTAQIPADAAPGTYFIIAMADGNGTVAESVETNNTSLAATVRLGPDLSVPTITAPATAAAGATISIGDTTRNAGAGPAPASTTTFYLSANATLDPSDTPLGARPVSALPAGTSESGSTPVQLPAGLPAGTMYVIAKADGNDMLLESSETNNASFGTAVRFGADLIVSTITAPPAAAAGATIQIGDTTRNQGSAGAPASITQFYVSANSTLDASDTPVGARPVSGLAAGISESGSTPVQIPADTPTGTVFVLAKADATDAVGESLETNNSSGAAIVRIGPDLTASNVTAPVWAAPGGTISVGATTRNQGAGTAGPSTTVFYLSNNALLDAADQPLGGRPVGSLTANAVDIGTAPVQIPGNTTTGLYFILAKADGVAAVVETIETNNASFAATVRIGTDLTVSALTAPSSAAAGSTIGVTDTTANPGTLGADRSTTRFYLSTNILLDGADVLLGSRSVGPLPAGGSETMTTPLTLPPGVTGSFYILAVADGNVSIVEVFEDNNIRSRPIQIAAQ